MGCLRATARSSLSGCAASSRPGRRPRRFGRTCRNRRNDQGQGPPPAAAAEGDPAFRAEETQEFSRKDIDGMKACLVEGRSIAFAFPVFDSWYKSSAMARWGKITMPLPGEPALDGHAVTIVGYKDDPAAPGGGYFLLRNSWQPWAWDGAWQPGYGYIPYAYISRHASAIFSARRGEDARPCVRGEDAEGPPRLDRQQPRRLVAPGAGRRRRATGGGRRAGQRALRPHHQSRPKVPVQGVRRGLLPAAGGGELGTRRERLRR